MWKALHSARLAIQPVVTGWLAVALLLPTLLGLLPAAQAASTASILQSVDYQLCQQLGHDGQGQDKNAPGHQNHDCPCCLPTAAGLAALPPIDPALLPVPVWHAEKLALVEFTHRLFARQPYGLAPARGPPASLSV